MTRYWTQRREREREREKCVKAYDCGNFFLYLQETQQLSWANVCKKSNDVWVKARDGEYGWKLVCI